MLLLKRSEWRQARAIIFRRLRDPRYAPKEKDAWTKVICEPQRLQTCSGAHAYAFGLDVIASCRKCWSLRFTHSPRRVVVATAPQRSSRIWWIPMLLPFLSLSFFIGGFVSDAV